MKKLALLLAALSVASVSYAKEVMPVAEEVMPVADVVVVEEPVVKETVAVEMKAAPEKYCSTSKLKVVSIGQSLEFDNHAGGADISETVYFYQNVNMMYGDDWKIDLQAHKAWSMDTDDGVESAGARAQLTATRLFDGFTVGTRWRGESSYDRFYLMGSYKMGDFSGNGYVGYTFSNGQDYIYSEITPIQYNFGPAYIGLYNEYKGYTGEDGAQTNLTQIRIGGDFYETEKLTLGAEARYGVYSGDNWLEGRRPAGSLPEGDDTYMAAQLNAEYALTENLTIDGYYTYEIHSNEWNSDDNYYGELCLGWTYKF